MSIGTEILKLTEGKSHGISSLTVVVEARGADATTWRNAGTAVSPKDIEKSVQYARDEQKDVARVMKAAWGKVRPDDKVKVTSHLKDDDIRIRAIGNWMQVEVLTTLGGGNASSMERRTIADEMQKRLKKLNYDKLTVKAG